MSVRYVEGAEDVVEGHVEDCGGVSRLMWGSKEVGGGWVGKEGHVENRGVAGYQ